MYVERPELPIDPCGSVRQESASERFGRGDYVQVPHLEIRVPIGTRLFNRFYQSVLSGPGAVPIAVPRNHSSR
jgi:hypothetical protein